MKLFVWYGPGVLEDYTSGMVVALGADLQEALGAVEKSCNYCLQSFPTESPSETIDLGDSKVEPQAWVCYGGG